MIYAKTKLDVGAVVDAFKELWTYLETYGYWTYLETYGYWRLSLLERKLQGKF